MEPKFLTGDVVRLVSGGPNMTIRGSHYDVLANEYKLDMFDCIWFDKNKEGRKEVHYCPFHYLEIEKVVNLGDIAA